VRETSAAGEEVALAREAAVDGAELVVACGGDGTLNGVVRGVHRAGRLGDVTVGVIPAGTGNGFADNVGVRGVEHAFDVLEDGETRRLDVGMVRTPGDGGDEGTRRTAGGTDDDAFPRPFLNSCVGGLTAEASVRTDPELKRRVGTLAYALTTLHQTRAFEGLTLDIRAGPTGDPVWSGEAVVLLVGNGRDFPVGQANLEDGMLDVVVIERAPAIDFLAQGATERLLRSGASHLTRLRVPSLGVAAARPRQFSLDGEMVERRRLDVEVRPRALPFKVGESYRPDPSDATGRHRR
jgi:YegS/Rv2252/BmrU family lipid kinase